MSCRSNAVKKVCYESIFILLQFIENNWRTGRHSIQRIVCRSEASKGVYCLQYDDQKIVSGLRDNTIKVSLTVYVAAAADGVIVSITFAKEVVLRGMCLFACLSVGNFTIKTAGLIFVIILP